MFLFSDTVVFIVFSSCICLRSRHISVKIVRFERCHADCCCSVVVKTGTQRNFIVLHFDNTIIGDSHFIHVIKW